MHVLQIEISYELNEDLKTYAKYVGLNDKQDALLNSEVSEEKKYNKKILSVIRFLLSEQITRFISGDKDFDDMYKKRRPKQLGDGKRKDGAGKDIGEKSIYVLKANDYIFDNIIDIAEKYEKNSKNEKNKKNDVVTNLLKIALQEKLSEYKKGRAINKDKLEDVKKRISLHISNAFWNNLIDISEIIGINENYLISLIVGNYLIEHYYNDYSDYSDYNDYSDYSDYTDKERNDP